MIPTLPRPPTQTDAPPPASKPKASDSVRAGRRPGTSSMRSVRIVTARSPLPGARPRIGSSPARSVSPSRHGRMMWRLPFFEALDGAQQILVAGARWQVSTCTAGCRSPCRCGNAAPTVHLANLSFVTCTARPGRLAEPAVAAVTPDTAGSGPTTSRSGTGPVAGPAPAAADRVRVPAAGVRPLRVAYRPARPKQLDLDAIVSVDGGTDILMRGDEAGWAPGGGHDEPRRRRRARRAGEAGAGWGSVRRLPRRQPHPGAGEPRRASTATAPTSARSVRRRAGGGALPRRRRPRPGRHARPAQHRQRPDRRGADRRRRRRTVHTAAPAAHPLFVEPADDDLLQPSTWPASRRKSLYLDPSAARRHAPGQPPHENGSTTRSPPGQGCPSRTDPIQTRTLSRAAIRLRGSIRWMDDGFPCPPRTGRRRRGGRELINVLVQAGGGPGGHVAAEIEDVVRNEVKDPAADTRLVTDADGRLVAVAMVPLPPAGGDRLELIGGVHPDRRGDRPRPELLAWQLDRAAARHAEVAPDATWLGAGHRRRDADTVRDPVLTNGSGSPSRATSWTCRPRPRRAPVAAGRRCCGSRRTSQARERVPACRAHRGVPRAVGLPGAQLGSWAPLTVQSEAFLPGLSRLALAGDAIVGVRADLRQRRARPAVHRARRHRGALAPAGRRDRVARRRAGRGRPEPATPTPRSTPTPRTPPAPPASMRRSASSSSSAWSRSAGRCGSRKLRSARPRRSASESGGV